MASGLSEGGYTALLRRSIIVQAMTESALASLPAPKALAETLYRERGEKRIAETVVVADAAKSSPRPRPMTSWSPSTRTTPPASPRPSTAR